MKETYRVEWNGVLHRRIVEFEDKTASGETVGMEILYSRPDAAGYNKNSLPVAWMKHGYTKELLPSYISINTYAQQPDGLCYGYYNPQEKISEDGKGRIINFDYMFPISEENERRLIQAVADMANKGMKHIA